MKKRYEIPPGHYQVCIVGKVTLERCLKNIFEILVLQGSDSGCIDYWVLIFDFQNLLYAENTGNNFQVTKDFFEHFCQNLKSLPAAELKKLYFSEAPDVLKKRYQKLLNRKWIESCLISQRN